MVMNPTTWTLELSCHLAETGGCSPLPNHVLCRSVDLLESSGSIFIVIESFDMCFSSERPSCVCRALSVAHGKCYKRELLAVFL